MGGRSVRGKSAQVGKVWKYHKMRRSSNTLSIYIKTSLRYTKIAYANNKQIANLNKGISKKGEARVL